MNGLFAAFSIAAAALTVSMSPGWRPGRMGSGISTSMIWQK